MQRSRVRERVEEREKWRSKNKLDLTKNQKHGILKLKCPEKKLKKKNEINIGKK